MARPLRIEFPGAIYHVISRGNEKQAIFKNVKDRRKFLNYLESASVRFQAKFHCYCLMGNHYHLLIETPLGNLSKIMQWVNSSYTAYFNKKNERVGHLFQGRYKSVLVEADSYLLELSRYIHLNPVRAGLVESPERYSWSSYYNYISDQAPPDWLHEEDILCRFSKIRQKAKLKYQEFIQANSKVDHNKDCSEMNGLGILGGFIFSEKIKVRYAGLTEKNRDLSEVKSESPHEVSLDLIDSGIDSFDFRNKQWVRQLKIYFSHQLSGQKLKVIANRYGISESGVTQASRRMENRIELDKTVAESVKKVENYLQTQIRQWV